MSADEAGGALAQEPGPDTERAQLRQLLGRGIQRADAAEQIIAGFERGALGGYQDWTEAVGRLRWTPELVVRALDLLLDHPAHAALRYEDVVFGAVCRQALAQPQHWLVPAEAGRRVVRLLPSDPWLRRLLFQGFQSHEHGRHLAARAGETLAELCNAVCLGALTFPPDPPDEHGRAEVAEVARQIHAGLKHGPGARAHIARHTWAFLLSELPARAVRLELLAWRGTVPGDEALPPSGGDRPRPRVGSRA